jgi:hypothetical protein
VPHFKSLRAIGQSLESFHVEVFELEKEGSNYVVRSESLPPTSHLIFRNSIFEKILDSSVPDQKGNQSKAGVGWLKYDPVIISRLDTQGRRKRRRHSFAQMRGANRLSQLLRTVGEYLDRREVSAFNVFWAPDSVSVDYQISGGDRERKSFSIEKLRELGLRGRFRRSKRGR